VDTLLISEGLRKLRLDIRCPNCGHTETRTVTDETTLPKCPNCGKDFVIDSRTDIVDAFSTLADRTNAKVELISADSDEGELLIKAFGGIAAILRYRVT
jgi:peptide chain release factor subunit 1